MRPRPESDTLPLAGSERLQLLFVSGSGAVVRVAKRPVSRKVVLVRYTYATQIQPAISQDLWQAENCSAQDKNPFHEGGQ